MVSGPLTRLLPGPLTPGRARLPTEPSLLVARCIELPARGGSSGPIAWSKMVLGGICQFYGIVDGICQFNGTLDGICHFAVFQIAKSRSSETENLKIYV